jgi:hypothetical protein
MIPEFETHPEIVAQTVINVYFVKKQRFLWEYLFANKTPVVC